MSVTRVPLSDGTCSAPLAHRLDHNEESHIVQFYAEDSFLLNVVSRFVGTALGAGDAAVVIATQAHRDGLAQKLGMHGLDTSSAVKNGRYVPLDAAEILKKFMRGGMPDKVRFLETVGGIIERAKTAAGREGPRVAAFGEMVALLWADGKPEAAIRLEQLWNELAETQSFSLCCAYPLAGFDSQDHGKLFLRICDEHSGVIPGETYTALLSEEDRLRNIAHMQQKERSHEALRRTKDRLEKEVAERMEAERKLQASEQALRELSGHLLRLQDEERRRLGKDLHDSLGQYLAVLKMGLDTLQLDIGLQGDETGRQVAECIRLADESIREVRTLSYLLYPPLLEEMGLESAIPWYIEGFVKRSGIQISLEIPPTFCRLSCDTELAIFRVLQESLTNVHRHSGSTTANVRVMIEAGAVILDVIDHGKGIAPNISALSPSAPEESGTVGVGLRSMNERVRQLGGKLELSSSNDGTCVRAWIPRAESSLL